MISFNKIGIVGAGSYGTAIAQCFSRKAKEVQLVSRSESTVLAINGFHANSDALPGVALNTNISCTDVFSEVCNSDIIFIATPVQAVSSVCRQIKSNKIKTPVVLCSKGFEIEYGRLQSELFEEILENDCAILSGPSFANEIAIGLPAKVNIASKSSNISKSIAKSLSSQTFKIEAIDDYIGLQVAGALKNVLAIGCGILSGLKLGNSAIAQLIVNGLREMKELAAVLGGKSETFSELCGIGDTLLTCTSRQSRNILFGEHLSAGGSIENWNGELAEGAATAKAIPIFKKKFCIAMEVFFEIYQIIYERKSISDSVFKILY